MKALVLGLGLLVSSERAYSQFATLTQIPLTTNIQSTVVASLPTCNAGAANYVYNVTDALTPVIGSTVSGGGAVATLVHCNGTNWVVG